MEKDRRKWENDGPSISSEPPLIRNKRCADDDHARYEYDAHEEGKPKPAGRGHASAHIQLPRQAMEPWTSGRHRGEREYRKGTTTAQKNMKLDRKSLPLQYSRHFLEEIRSFHFLLRGGPSDVI